MNEDNEGKAIEILSGSLFYSPYNEEEVHAEEAKTILEDSLLFYNKLNLSTTIDTKQLLNEVLSGTSTNNKNFNEETLDKTLLAAMNRNNLATEFSEETEKELEEKRKEILDNLDEVEDDDSDKTKD